MQRDRTLNWDGCSNARDLGGLETEDGRRIRWGAFVRSDDPAKLSPQGWSALYDHGIRTIISLRTDGMEEDDLVLPENLHDIEWLTLAIEDLGDQEFLEQWAASELWSTPLYYQDAIKRWPERHAAVFKAIVQAQEGGILIHCRRGIDRTGIISLMLLALLGVPDEEIVNDYMMSTDPEREELLRERNTTSQEVILNSVKDLDMEAYLLDVGLNSSDINKVKSRLLESL